MDYMEKFADALVRAIRRGEVNKQSLIGLGLKPRTILKSIGKPGAEGFAQLRTHPEHGVQVAKFHDKQSPFYGDKIFDLKAKILGMASKADPQHFAQQYGVDYDKKIMFSEYLSGPNNAGPRTKRVAEALKRKYGVIDFDKTTNHNVLGNKIYDVTLSTKVTPKNRLFDPKELDSPLAKNIRRAAVASEAWIKNTDLKRESRLRSRFIKANNKAATVKNFLNSVHNATRQEQEARINRILKETYGAR